jgi:hypothetical protein
MNNYIDKCFIVVVVEIARANLLSEPTSAADITHPYYLDFYVKNTLLYDVK